jgi:Fe-S cluster assembly ATP-binding protein
MPLFSIQNFSVSVEENTVVHEFNLDVKPGEVHAIMGPNGSGKSSLVSCIMGHPTYQVEGGDVLLEGESILELEPEFRAQKGLFLAMQYPREIAGVTLRDFLYAAYKAQFSARNPEQRPLSPLRFNRHLEVLMEGLSLPKSFATRFVNQGFSGGEKKKAEILQLLLLQPKVALLDETDSGLDIDALKIVTEGIARLKQEQPETAVVLVTHYARILHHLQPDYVHVMVQGRIVKSGGKELALELEERGYADY